MKFRKLLFSIILIGATLLSKAQTAGDLAVLNVTPNKDTIRLIALNTIPANSTFIITDNPWITSSFGGNEGYLTWATGASAINPEAVILFSTSSSATAPWNSQASVTTGSVTASTIGATGSANGFSISTSGDNIFILNRISWSSSPSNAEFIWGISTHNSGWTYNSVSNQSNTSDLPSVLSSFSTSL
ncbi:MAG: hypothetical protein NTZ59_15750, partial [Bacteroidetes bacterium]|nr:hypothetical protein [Bacteroidota bacterium]